MAKMADNDNDNEIDNDIVNENDNEASAAKVNFEGFPQKICGKLIFCGKLFRQCRQTHFYYTIFSPGAQ